MDISIKRSGIACCEKIFEYAMPVEEASETVVPDTMPDVERILCAEGMVMIRSKDVSEGAVKVSAGVSVTVLYSPEGGSGVCALASSIPVDVSVEAPEVTESSLAVAMLTVTGVDARMLNPRKLLVRVVVNVEISCYAHSELSVTTGLDGEGAASVETLTESASISPVVCVKEKTFVVSDEYRLQPGLLPIGSLLWHTVEVVPGSVRSVGTKLIFNGSVKLSVLYEAENSGELCQASFETEYSQMLDAETDFTSPDCGVYTLLTAEYVEPLTLSGGERGINAEFHLVSQCVCTDSVRVQCMTDCYSNTCELDIGRSQTEMSCVQRRSTVRASVNDTISAVPSPVSISRVICRTGAAQCEAGTLKCPVSATVIYTSSDGEVYSVSHRVTCEAPSELAEGEYAEAVHACCAESSATIAQGGINLRVVVDFELVCARRQTFTQISSVEPLEAQSEAERPSVTVIRARDNDTLWTLGKRYHSTAALITELNGLGDGERLAGRVLLIPLAK